MKRCAQGNEAADFPVPDRAIMRETQKAVYRKGCCERKVPRRAVKGFSRYFFLYFSIRTLDLQTAFAKILPPIDFFSRLDYN